MTEDSINYLELAWRSVDQPLLALYACCPRCGGDIGIHAGFATLLDCLYGTGVKFCDYGGKDCKLDHDAREWAWSRHFAARRARTTASHTAAVPRRVAS